MHLNGFTQNSCSSQNFGQWKSPHEGLARGYTDTEFWVEMARTCERGFFDGLFFADTHGAKDVYQGGFEPTARAGVQFPANDPTVLPPLLARETEHLGFILTWSAGYFPPYHTARLFSTLDHLTNGRVGWNVVTSYMSAALRNGMGTDVPHAERYDRAEEYMDVVYKLWEHSWDDDAIVLDAASNTFADPARIHRIDHEGTYYSVEGPHACEPSPQRSPLIVQAGGSPRGNAFAGKHAEAVFLVSTGIENCARSVARLRDAAAAEGRDPRSVKAMVGMSWVVAGTEREARAKYDDYAAHGDLEGVLSILGGQTGVDFTGFDPDSTMDGLSSSGITSLARMFSGVDGRTRWTFGEMCEYLKLSYVSPVLVGTPEQVADQMERWMDEADVDGFNLAPIRAPGDLRDFVDLVVPVLQARGRVRTSYTGSTLRERFTGSPRLAPDHPARRLSTATSTVPGPAAGTGR
jgi:FMN-dependent oxidoreductase (nitrilotriacetate monooxygenase family)